MSPTEEYRDLFVAEARENLRALSDGALSLERPGDAKEGVDALFRAAHSLKGMAATMGFEGIAHLCHSLEDTLDELRLGRRAGDPELSDALLAAVDAMTTMVDDVASGGDGGRPREDLLDRFKAVTVSADPAPHAAPMREAYLPEDAQARRVVSVAAESGQNVLKFWVTLEPECAFKGVRALLVRKALERMVTVLATRPEAQALEAGDFDEGFEIWTAGPTPVGEQEEAIRRVLEVVAVRFEPVSGLAAVGPFRPPAEGYRAPEPMDESLALAPLESVLGAAGIPASGAVVPGAASSMEAVAEAQADQTQPVAGAVRQTVRVSVERLDKVLDLVGELVTAKIRLNQIAHGSGTKELGKALIQVDHIVDELQAEVTAARLVPMDQIFSRFPRLIRDLSREMGKRMELVFEGREIELDRSILDELDEALVHLLRNAADHGIESPQRRAEAGKPATGTIRLEARRDRSHVVVVVEDDGAGIDTARVREVALAKGLVSPDIARSMSDEEALALIFSPGFTTADRVTRLSGRGVGMDAARARVEALGGSLRVENVPGKGARFRLRVPLTLAIIKALRVRVGQEHYMAPVANVVEAVEFPRAELRSGEAGRSVLLRGEDLPLRRLDELLDVPRGEETDFFTVLVAEAGERRAGLIVDEVLGQQEIAVKNLALGLKSVRGFGGVTILGDGSVHLILDLPSLLDI